MTLKNIAKIRSGQDGAIFKDLLFRSLRSALHTTKNIGDHPTEQETCARTEIL